MAVGVSACMYHTKDYNNGVSFVHGNNAVIYTEGREGLYIDIITNRSYATNGVRPKEIMGIKCCTGLDSVLC